MKILYDSQLFELQNYGGISKYFCSLLKNIVLEQNIEVTLPFEYTNNYHLLEHFDQFKIPPFDEQDVLKKQFRREVQKIVSEDYDLMHPTYYDPYFLKLIGDRPFVLTIHDMIYEIFPEQFVGDVPIAEYKARLARAASHIIAVSEHTKQDIMRILNIEGNKITVIHHGIDHKEIIGNSGKIKLPSQYLLYIGERRSAYKNFYFFIKSLLPLFIDYPDLYIICTGSPFNEYELQYFNRLGIQNHLHHIFVNESDLPYLYNKALAFIYPSLYEGFGLPILEAFDALCPVILSSCSCFPEVAQDSALYFDVNSVGDLTDKIKKIIESESLRQFLIQKGKQRSLSFSWKKTALETIAVYKKVLCL